MQSMQEEIRVVTTGCSEHRTPRLTIPTMFHLPSAPWHITGPPLSPCIHTNIDRLIKLFYPSMRKLTKNSMHFVFVFLHITCYWFSAVVFTWKFGWYVILFLSRKKFHAKQIFVLSSSMKLAPEQIYPGCNFSHSHHFHNAPNNIVQVTQLCMKYSQKVKQVCHDLFHVNSRYELPKVLEVDII